MNAIGKSAKKSVGVKVLAEFRMHRECMGCQSTDMNHPPNLLMQQAWTHGVPGDYPTYKAFCE